MKDLKFAAHLVPLVLSGTKTVTWRLFDDKDLQVGDDLVFINRDTGEEFAQAKIVAVREIRLGDITPKDEVGHEPFNSRKERIQAYKEYYGDQVTEDEMVKILEFELRKI